MSAEAIINQHFALQEQIKTLYPRRADPEIYAAIVESCQQMITLAPQAVRAFKADYKQMERRRKQHGSPSHGPFHLWAHLGYTQLAIIREKEKDYAEVIRLCNQAKGQGWDGDWDKRIARCEKKLAR